MNAPVVAVVIGVLLGFILGAVFGVGVAVRFLEWAHKQPASTFSGDVDEILRRRRGGR